MSVWPRTLFGRVAVVVCGGLALAHVLTLAIIWRERGDLGRSMMLAYVGRDVAASVAILDRLPASERTAWLPRLARQNYRYVLGDAPAGGAPADALGEAVAQVVSTELGTGRAGPMRMLPDAGMLLPLRLADGTPLQLRLEAPRNRVSAGTLALLALQLAALIAAAWLGVRLAVRPMARLAQAADAMHPGAQRGPLAESGPREVMQAVRAFNALQARVDAHLAERMQLLAAISHDLQTPITRMRLRTEQLSEDALRSRFQADLADMQALVEEGLAYARSAQAAQEPARPVDLHALLDGLVCDAVDAGHAVTLQGRHATPLVTRVLALRRVMTNLIDNALKFGGAAAPVQVSVCAVGAELRLAVSDRGPGIPVEHLDAVLQPFYRLEASRNRATGGTGLGLAIAHQLALALGGRLVLANREGGGLEAALWLPLLPD